jgi:sec-independent protein translocase protein TatC
VATSAEPQEPQRPDRNDEKNLTILEHLQELRRRLMYCAIALVIALVASAFLANRALRWLREPAESRVENFELIFTQPLEYWTTFFRVMLLLAITFAMPVFVYQLLAFVGPGLTKNEKRWAYPIIAGASFMFVAGCAFAYYIEMPPALNFLLDAPDDIAKPFITVKSYVDFATRLMLVTGLVFETPFIVMGLALIGIVDSKKLLRWWRFAIVGSFILSAVVTPSIDPITQTFVAGPMIVLYFVGIGLAKLVEGHRIIPPA